MTQLEKLLSVKNYDLDSLLTNSCPMDFGMRGDTSFCPTGCERCWNIEYEETDYSIEILSLIK